MRRGHTMLILTVIGLAVLTARWPSVAASPLEEGVALYEAGRYADALPLLLRAVNLEQNNVRAWIWLGATYFQLNRLQQARQSLERAVALDPRSAAAYLFLGATYARLGQIDKARTTFGRVRALAPDSLYALSASEWLRVLAAGPLSNAAPSPKPAASCPKPAALPAPKPPALPAPKPPTSMKTREAMLQISDWELEVQKEELVVVGEAENLGESEVVNVRVQATGFGLDGRQVTLGTAVLGGVGSEDTRDFTLRLSTKPPVIWVQLQIQDYAGRRQGDPLDALIVPVDIQEYGELARTRIKISASVLPPGIEKAHTVCMQISDPAGFPVQAVGVRLMVNGTASGKAARQVKAVDVTAVEGGSAQVNWSDAMRVTPLVEVESVRFAPLPAIRTAP